VFDLRTSSNASAGWICDAPYSWSEPPVFCGTTLWALDAKMGGGASHATLTPEQEGVMSDRQIVNAAIGRLNGSNPNHTALQTPWLVAVGVHRPHLPLIVPQFALDLHPPASVVLPPNRFGAPTNMPLAATECAGGGRTLPGHSSMELWQQYTYNSSVEDWDGWTGVINTSIPDPWAVTLKRYYQAAVSHTDLLFGEVLDAVRARGDFDNTIVVMFGDHGWHLAEMGMWCKCTNFEPATRAPLLIRVPGVTDAGVTSSALSEHVDLLPTLAEAAGMPVVPTCPRDSAGVKLCTDGVSLLPLARSPGAIVKKAAFSEWPHPFASQQPASIGYSIRTATARYTEWVYVEYSENGTHLPQWSHRCARELYNDTTESINVAEDPARAADVAYHAGLLRLGWRVAAGAAPWPTMPPLPPTTVALTCPVGNGPGPGPPPVPPTVTPGSSRRCSNATAQGNSSDTSCWCQPAVVPVRSNNRVWPDCQRICADDPLCRSWTFSSNSGCFRHSTAATHIHHTSGPDSKTTWSGCEHPQTCPT
jgi:iduronate 2-sulfatase